jgi:hypothetical protein
MASLTGSEDLDLALDLLVAHASINSDLRQELLNNPEAACLAHGINLPVGAKLVFSSKESPVIVKEIPVASSVSITTEKTDCTAKDLVSTGLNSTSETTTETAESATAETAEATVEAQSNGVVVVDIGGGVVAVEVVVLT